MNPPLFERKPPVAILESTGKWQTTINLNYPQIRAQRVLDLRHLSSEIRCTTGLIAVIELTTKQDNLWERLKFAGFNASNPNQACFVGVVDDRLSDFERELNRFGFREVYNNLFQLANFRGLYEKQCQRVHWPNTSIERQVETNLPWPIVSRHSVEPKNLKR